MSSLSDDEDSFEGKSWIEMCDAERIREEKLNEENVRKSTRSETIIDIPDTRKTSDNEDSSENEPLGEKPNLSGKFQSKLKTNLETSKKTSFVEEEIKKGPKSEYDDHDAISNDSITPQKSHPVKCQTPVSYAKVVQGLKEESNCTQTKMDTASSDDLSLTSHLDIFHVASPIKTLPKIRTETNFALDENTVMFSPRKGEIPVKNMKRPFQLIESPKPRLRSASDKGTHKIAKSIANSDVHSSNIEEIEEGAAHLSNVEEIEEGAAHLSNLEEIEEGEVSGSEDDRGRDTSSPNLKRELEVNPEIISRRQKQIDYGKNTLGYGRYIKVIPKHKRNKEHPKTPPKHLKMSRRAWDGLVKNWRLKLHRWDPILEKDAIDFENTNFDQYSFSSEEPSSYDSSSVRSDSAPSTPLPQSNGTGSEEMNEPQWTHNNSKSECSKELWSACQPETKESNDDEFLGCELLTESCVKAYS